MNQLELPGFSRDPQQSTRNHKPTTRTSHPQDYTGRPNPFCLTFVGKGSDGQRGLRTDLKGKRKTVAEVVGKEGKQIIWCFTWPDGDVLEGSVTHFSSLSPCYSILGLGEPQTCGLMMRLPRFSPGQPMTVVVIPGLCGKVVGLWSLWQLSLIYEPLTNPHYSSLTLQRRFLLLLVADNGKIYSPTSRYICDQLLATNQNVSPILKVSVSQPVFEKLWTSTEKNWRIIYKSLVHEHRAKLSNELEKAHHAFCTRHGAIEGVGLPQVRHHSSNLLVQEELRLQAQLKNKTQPYVEMVPLVEIRLEGNNV